MCDLNLHLDKDVWSQKFNGSRCVYNFNQIIDSQHSQPYLRHFMCLGYLFRGSLPEGWGGGGGGGGLSDHLAITSTVDIPIMAPCKFRQVNSRKTHGININYFRVDILYSGLIKHPHKTASLLIHQYFNTLRNILDRHAPVKRKNEFRHPVSKASEAEV